MLPASNADEIDKVTSPPRSAPTGRENHGTVHRPDGRSRRRARRRFPSARSHGLPRSRLRPTPASRSEEHTSELQSLMRISYAVFCLKKKKKNTMTVNKTIQYH